MREKENNHQFSILNMNFDDLEKQQEFYKNERDIKIKIFESLAEYIKFLEDLLASLEDSYQRELVERKIKEIKNEQKKYYVPSMLELSSYDLATNVKTFKSSLEKSSFSLVKKIKRKDYS